MCVDDGLVTSRKPADLSAFCDTLVEQFAAGVRQRRRVSAEATPS